MNGIAFRLLESAPPIAQTPLFVLLTQATAAAFRSAMPGLRGLSHEGRRREYAQFTARRCERVLAGGDDVERVRDRLYRNAYRLGRLSGLLLGVRTLQDVMAAGRLLYGIIGVNLWGDDKGEIIIDRCIFSSFYTPAVCQMMSAMDRGLFAGLAGGGELVFRERITEGRACCRARFLGPG